MNLSKPQPGQSTSDTPSFPIEREWTRVDNLAGLILQTALVVQIAAFTFALQLHGLPQIWLFVACGVAFVAALLSFLSLGIEPANGKPQKRNWLWCLYKEAATKLGKRPPETPYAIKHGYARVGLYLVVAAVEGGTLFPIATGLPVGSEKAHNHSNRIRDKHTTHNIYDRQSGRSLQRNTNNNSHNYRYREQ